jgi:integrase
MLIGDPLLVEITAEHFDRYKSERLKRISPVTVNIELRCLRAAFNTARRWKLIERHPFVDVSMASVPRQTPTFVSPQDFQRLLEGIQEKWLRDVVVFAVLTGMRRGEILNLRWLDVDLVRRVLHIETRPGFHSKQGKRRTIPLNKTALVLLHSRRGKSASEFVFTLNDRQIFGDWVTHLFKRYVRKVGLDNDRLRFHSLRHTFASWLVQGGATLYEVQKLLGHSSPRVTEIYSHLQPEQLHDTVNRIEVPLN